MLSSDVLPAPLGPMIDTIRPRGTSSEMSWPAVTPPNFFDTPSTTSWLSPSATDARRAAAAVMNPPYQRFLCLFVGRHDAGSDGLKQQFRLGLGLPARTCDMSRHIVCLTFDHDHMSGFIARGLTTPTYISRGEYDMVVIPRLVTLLARYDIKATFFTPGHTIDSTPKPVTPYVEAGPDLAHHRWTHPLPRP